MDEFRYPLVSELVYRAQNHDIKKLSLIPIGQLWQIDPVEPGAVLKQLSRALDDPNLDAGERLKLGYLAVYSWHIHYHPYTENILLRTQQAIDPKFPEESLLFWGVMAGYYLRKNEVIRALQNLSSAFNWAANNAKIDDIFPLLSWTILCLSRINSQTTAFQISEWALQQSKKLEDSHRVQCFSYSRAHTLLRMGNYKDCQSSYETLYQHILAGTDVFGHSNQVGVVNGLAKIALANHRIGDAERLLAFSNELNSQTKESLLLFRNLVLESEFHLAKSDKKKAHDGFAALSAHRDSNAFDLDIPVELQVLQLQRDLHLGAARTHDTTKQPNRLKVELAANQLCKSFKRCLSCMSYRDKPRSMQPLH